MENSEIQDWQREAALQVDGDLVLEENAGLLDERVAMNNESGINADEGTDELRGAFNETVRKTLQLGRKTLQAATLALGAALSVGYVAEAVKPPTGIKGVDEAEMKRLKEKIKKENEETARLVAKNKAEGVEERRVKLIYLLKKNKLLMKDIRLLLNLIDHMKAKGLDEYSMGKEGKELAIPENLDEVKNGVVIVSKDSPRWKALFKELDIDPLFRTVLRSVKYLIVTDQYEALNDGGAKGRYFKDGVIFVAPNIKPLFNSIIIHESVHSAHKKDSLPLLEEEMIAFSIELKYLKIMVSKNDKWENNPIVRSAIQSSENILKNANYLKKLAKNEKYNFLLKLYPPAKILTSSLLQYLNRDELRILTTLNGDDEKRDEQIRVAAKIALLQFEFQDRGALIKHLSEKYLNNDRVGELEILNVLDLMKYLFPKWYKKNIEDIAGAARTLVYGQKSGEKGSGNGRNQSVHRKSNSSTNDANNCEGKSPGKKEGGEEDDPYERVKNLDSRVNVARRIKNLTKAEMSRVRWLLENSLSQIVNIAIIAKGSRAYDIPRLINIEDIMADFRNYRDNDQNRKINNRELLFNVSISVGALNVPGKPKTESGLNLFDSTKVKRLGISTSYMTAYDAMLFNIEVLKNLTNRDDNNINAGSCSNKKTKPFCDFVKHFTDKNINAVSKILVDLSNDKTVQQHLYLLEQVLDAYATINMPRDPIGTISFLRNHFMPNNIPKPVKLLQDLPAGTEIYYDTWDGTLINRIIAGVSTMVSASGRLNHFSTPPVKKKLQAIIFTILNDFRLSLGIKDETLANHTNVEANFIEKKLAYHSVFEMIRELKKFDEKKVENFKYAMAETFESRIRAALFTFKYAKGQPHEWDKKYFVQISNNPLPRGIDNLSKMIEWLERDILPAVKREADSVKNIPYYYSYRYSPLSCFLNITSSGDFWNSDQIPNTETLMENLSLLWRAQGRSPLNSRKNLHLAAQINHPITTSDAHLIEPVIVRNILDIVWKLRKTIPTRMSFKNTSHRDVLGVTDDPAFPWIFPKK